MPYGYAGLLRPLYRCRQRPASSSRQCEREEQFRCRGRADLGRSDAGKSGHGDDIRTPDDPQDLAGWIYDPEGIDVDLLREVKEVKTAIYLDYNEGKTDTKKLEKELKHLEDVFSGKVIHLIYSNILCIYIIY